MGEAIAITSGKGGVGKSSVCINVGMVLAQRGYKVCLIDVDLGLKNLDMMLGLENRVIYDLKDVMEGRCTLANVMVRDKRQENLFLLPACKSIHIQYFHGDDLKIVVDQLKKEFDFILLDTPAGIESGFQHAISCADKAIIVTTLDVTSLQDADRIIGILLKERMEHISFVVNRMNVSFIEKGISVSLEEARQWLAIDFLGYVFDDEQMVKSNNYGKPLVLSRDSLTYMCFDCIVKRMLGQHCQLPKFKEKGFLQKLFG